MLSDSLSALWMLVGRRRGTYGQLIGLFEQIATRWSLVLGVKVTPAQTVLSLVDLKLQGWFTTRGTSTASRTSPAMPAAWWRLSAMRELRSHLGRYQPERIDPEAEKRSGWRRHGILVVAEQDPRLSWPERELIRQLGARLYGRRSGVPQ